MSHLHALICFEGRDHNIRFLLLSLAIYLVFIINSLLFGDSIALFVLLNFALLIVMTATANRRVRDARIPGVWQLMPVGVFTLVAFLPLLYAHDSLFTLLLAIPATLLMTIKPSAEVHHYVWGYDGPINFEDANASVPASTQYADRIEPTFVSGQDEHYGHKQASDQPVEQSSQPTTQSSTQYISPQPINDWYEPMRLFMLKHQTITLGISGILLLTTVVGLTYPLFTSGAVDITEAETEQIEAQDEQQSMPFINQVRQYPFEMPTNDYSLMLSEHNGLIIHWPSYDENNPQLWSLVSAKGELSCEHIEFNGGQKIRTLLVSIEDDGDYYASFSPLDTPTLVTGIADKSKFTLCGYDFSLKGTRAAISQSDIYGAFLQ